MISFTHRSLTLIVLISASSGGQTYLALVLQGFGQLLALCRGSGRQAGESQQDQTHADGHDEGSNNHQRSEK